MAVLSLPRTPPADTLEGTVAVWREALTDGMVWDETRDAWRIRTAFKTLIKTCEMWPGPKRLLDCMPRVPRQRALPARLADPLVAAKAQTEIRAMLGARGREATRDRPMVGGLSEAARQIMKSMETPRED